MAPHHILAKKGDIAERVIVAGDPGRVRQLAKFLESPRRVNGHRGLLVYTGKYNGVDISVATHGMGAPSAAIIFEELGMLGAKKFVRFGTAGALSPDVRIGDYIIASSASHPHGGLYVQYFGEESQNDADADSDLTGHLMNAFTSRNLKFHKGKVFSSDALYAESSDFAKKRCATGDIAVEMECAILYKLSKARGWKCSSALMVVNDINGKDAWLPKKEINRRVSEGVHAIIDSLSKV